MSACSSSRAFMPISSAGARPLVAQMPSIVCPQGSKCATPRERCCTTGAWFSERAEEHDRKRYVLREDVFPVNDRAHVARDRWRAMVDSGPRGYFFLTTS